jgi:hypothetical protein
MSVKTKLAIIADVIGLSLIFCGFVVHICSDVFFDRRFEHYAQSMAAVGLCIFIPVSMVICAVLVWRIVRSYE